MLTASRESAAGGSQCLSGNAAIVTGRNLGCLPPLPGSPCAGGSAILVVLQLAFATTIRVPQFGTRTRRIGELPNRNAQHPLEL